MDWEVSEPLPMIGKDLEVWLDNGSVRRVMWVFGYLRFTDCTHPMQNVNCDPRRVRGWRLVRAPLEAA